MEEQEFTGIYDEMPARQYHDAPGLSKSGLVKFHRSPLHYITPEKITPEKQRVFNVGHATHTLILEPDLEKKTVMVMPEGVNKTHKAGREMAAECAKSGHVLLSHDQYEKIRGMRLAVWEHPKASRILEGALCERSVFWTHPEYGFKSKARWDFWKEGEISRILGDLKTTDDARFYPFQRVYTNMKYYWQGDWYLTGAQEVLGPKENEVFVFIVVERDPPHGVMVYDMSLEDRLTAMEEMIPLLRSYDESLRTGHWPSYPTETGLISLPRWAQKKIFN